MPKRVSDTELDAIVDAVARFPDGASVNQISKLTDILFRGAWPDSQTKGA